MGSFENKTVLVTGASSGIGEDFARLLAAEQANLVLTARNENKLRELARELEQTHQIQAHIFPADLSQPGTPERLYKRVEKAGLQVDVLINNAAFGKWGGFLDHDLATYMEMCTLNMNALVALTHLFLPGMLARGEGGILNVASTAGFQSVPYFATYSATKAFVISFSEALWAECKDRGVTVTCLCPGGTATNFHQRSQIAQEKLRGLEPSEKVARVGLRALRQGKPLVISGVRNALLALSVRFVPRKFAVQAAAAIMRPGNSSGS